MWTDTLRRIVLVAAALVVGTSGTAAADGAASTSFARLTADLFAPAVAVEPGERVPVDPKTEPTNPATMDSLFDLGPEVIVGVEPAAVWVDNAATPPPVVGVESTGAAEPIVPAMPDLPLAAGPVVTVGAPAFVSGFTPAASTSQRLPLAPAVDIRGVSRGQHRRPPTMLPLYVTFAALQMLDGHSTTKALKGGAVEANAVMAPFAGNAGALYATKIATTAATIYLGEKLWRKNRLAAIATLLVVNSAYAAVVSHNYSVANR